MSASYYSHQKPGHYFDQLSLKKRLEMLDMFLREFPGQTTSHVLDVGVTADRSALASNYFEKNYPVKSKIVALSNQDASFLEDIYPGLTFRQGDARELPFQDKSMDVVFSSAVIEHIGTLADQRQMLSECYRVAKQGVFITTPNRWYPVEFHTLIPFLHWLPKWIHRFLLRKLGKTFFAEEKNLNLLDRATLSRLCRELGIKQYYIRTVSTFGLTSNLVLVIKK